MTVTPCFAEEHTTIPNDKAEEKFDTPQSKLDESQLEEAKEAFKDTGSLKNFFESRVDPAKLSRIKDVVNKIDDGKLSEENKKTINDLLGGELVNQDNLENVIAVLKEKKTEPKQVESTASDKKTETASRTTTPDKNARQYGPVQETYGNKQVTDSNKEPAHTKSAEAVKLELQAEVNDKLKMYPPSDKATIAEQRTYYSNVQRISSNLLNDTLFGGSQGQGNLANSSALSRSSILPPPSSTFNTPADPARVQALLRISKEAKDKLDALNKEFGNSLYQPINQSDALGLTEVQRKAIGLNGISSLTPPESNATDADKIAYLDKANRALGNISAGIGLISSLSELEQRAIKERIQTHVSRYEKELANNFNTFSDEDRNAFLSAVPTDRKLFYAEQSRNDYLRLAEQRNAVRQNAENAIPVDIAEQKIAEAQQRLNAARQAKNEYEDNKGDESFLDFWIHPGRYDRTVNENRDRLNGETRAAEEQLRQAQRVLAQAKAKTKDQWTEEAKKLSEKTNEQALLTEQVQRHVYPQALASVTMNAIIAHADKPSRETLEMIQGVNVLSPDQVAIAKKQEVALMSNTAEAQVLISKSPELQTAYAQMVEAYKEQMNSQLNDKQRQVFSQMNHVPILVKGENGEYELGVRSEMKPSDATKVATQVTAANLHIEGASDDVPKGAIRSNAIPIPITGEAQMAIKVGLMEHGLDDKPASTLITRSRRNDNVAATGDETLVITAIASLATAAPRALLFEAVKNTAVGAGGGVIFGTALEGTRWLDRKIDGKTYEFSKENVRDAMNSGALIANAVAIAPKIVVPLLAGAGINSAVNDIRNGDEITGIFTGVLSAATAYQISRPTRTSLTPTQNQPASSTSSKMDAIKAHIERNTNSSERANAITSFEKLYGKTPEGRAYLDSLSAGPTAAPITATQSTSAAPVTQAIKLPTHTANSVAVVPKPPFQTTIASTTAPTTVVATPSTPSSTLLNSTGNTIASAVSAAKTFFSNLTSPKPKQNSSPVEPSENNAAPLKSSVSESHTQLNETAEASATKQVETFSSLDQKFSELANIPPAKRKGKTTDVINMLAEADLPADKKAELWNKFSSELGKKTDFMNESGRGKDGSYIFRGHVGEVLIIKPDGTVYKTAHTGVEKLSPVDGMQVNYSALTPVKDKIARAKALAEAKPDTQLTPKQLETNTQAVVEKLNSTRDANNKVSPDEVKIITKIETEIRDYAKANGIKLDPSDVSSKTYVDIRTTLEGSRLELSAYNSYKKLIPINGGDPQSLHVVKAKVEDALGGVAKLSEMPQKQREIAIKNKISELYRTDSIKVDPKNTDLNMAAKLNTDPKQVVTDLATHISNLAGATGKLDFPTYRAVAFDASVPKTKENLQSNLSRGGTFSAALSDQVAVGFLKPGSDVVLYEIAPGAKGAAITGKGSAVFETGKAFRNNNQNFASNEVQVVNERLVITGIEKRTVNGQEVTVVKMATETSHTSTDVPATQKLPETAEERAVLQSQIMGKYNVNPDIQKAIDSAHKIGEGQVGKDGTSAKHKNYTDAQLQKKYEILKSAFDKANIPDKEGAKLAKNLIEKGVVGETANKVLLEDVISRNAQTPSYESPASLSTIRDDMDNLNSLRAQNQKMLLEGLLDSPEQRAASNAAWDINNKKITEAESRIQKNITESEASAKTKFESAAEKLSGIKQKSYGESEVQAALRLKAEYQKVEAAHRELAENIRLRQEIDKTKPDSKLTTDNFVNQLAKEALDTASLQALEKVRGSTQEQLTKLETSVSTQRDNTYREKLKAMDKLDDLNRNKSKYPDAEELAEINKAQQNLTNLTTRLTQFDSVLPPRGNKEQSLFERVIASTDSAFNSPFRLPSATKTNSSNQSLPFPISTDKKVQMQKTSDMTSKQSTVETHLLDSILAQNPTVRRSSPQNSSHNGPVENPGKLSETSPTQISIAEQYGYPELGNIKPNEYNLNRGGVRNSHTVTEGEARAEALWRAGVPRGQQPKQVFVPKEHGKPVPEKTQYFYEVEVEGGKKMDVILMLHQADAAHPYPHYELGIPKRGADKKPILNDGNSGDRSGVYEYYSTNKIVVPIQGLSR